jgi:hypothetical protein
MLGVAAVSAISTRDVFQRGCRTATAQRRTNTTTAAAAAVGAAEATSNDTEAITTASTVATRDAAGDYADT